MQCPKCAGELLIGERAGIEIDYCNQCRGIWLDAGELDKIVERSRQYFQQGHAPPGQPASHQPYPNQAQPNQQPAANERRESWWESIIDIFD